MSPKPELQISISIPEASNDKLNGIHRNELAAKQYTQIQYVPISFSIQK